MLPREEKYGRRVLQAPRIDPQEYSTLSAGNVLARDADSRNCPASAAFDHDQSRIVKRLDPVIQTLHLKIGPG